MENNRKPETFAAEKTKEEPFISSSIDVVQSKNVKPEKNHLILRCKIE